MDEFQREYNSVKIKDNESKKLKIWEVLNENKKNARFSPKKEVNVSKKDAEAGFLFILKKFYFFYRCAKQINK